MPKLDLSITAFTGKPFVPWMQRQLLKAHETLKPPLGELSLVLVGDARMSALHEQFMNIPGPTDVLTFPMEHDRRGRPTAGEVIVCVPEARRRSKLEGTELRDELLLYAIHGMLHLSGFDDTTPAKFRAIHREEDRILGLLGIGKVFAAEGAGRPPHTPKRPRRQSRSKF